MDSFQKCAISHQKQENFFLPRRLIFDRTPENKEKPRQTGEREGDQRSFEDQITELMQSLTEKEFSLANEYQNDPKTQKRIKEMADAQRKELEELQKKYIDRKVLITQITRGAQEAYEKVESKVGKFAEDVMKIYDREVKIRNLKEWFKLNYQVDIRFADKEEKFGQGGSGDAVKDFNKAVQEVENLKAQLAKIPPDFFKKLGIKEFIFHGKMTQVGGGDEADLAAAAAPWSSSVHMIAAWPLHHEFFHIMDGKFAKGLESNGQSTDVELFMNYYQSSEKQNKLWGSFDSDSLKENYDEQQAEYSRILFNLNDKQVYEEQYVAKILPYPGKVKKMEQMKKWLLEWSDGKFNEQYWKDLQEGKVTEDYWKKREAGK